MKIGKELITWSNFHWVGLLIWIFVFISLLCLWLGINKRSGWLLLLSALTVFPMAFYLFGAENWIKFVILVPIVEVILAIVFWFRPNKNKGIES
ncbi:hypothetical protein [Neobacillus sp. OS1-33]|uniref:hypothetical protein n=1 Tax=Neobacillus sp. OS1-33 TaxID=3070683 RepID=UPI0027E041E9|nr:hypothetical protein [Neobacillus sp. OS1-33]WML26853.1 hypothetical protein RCG22_04240 [Neobacillus sp. OS1-33]